MKTSKWIEFFPLATELKICRQRCPKIRTWTACFIHSKVFVGRIPFCRKSHGEPRLFTEVCPHRLALIIYLFYSHPALMTYAQTQNCYTNLKYLEYSKIDRRGYFD